MSALAARGLAKSFGRLPVLGDVSLELARGELVAVVGPSGCGKSTLLRILAGLLVPDAGEALLDGAPPPEGAPPNGIRPPLLGCVGYLPQGDLLMPWRRTLDNLTLGLELAGTRRADARQQAHRELDRFGLAGFERHWPRELSGGMRRRAALLRTFLAGRDVLLLDEPFAALDSLTREELCEWLLAVWESDRKTILLVTHDVEEAVLLSDRVYVLSHRPARVLATVDVPLPRPRRAELAASPELVALAQQVRAPLRADRLAGAGR